MTDIRKNLIVIIFLLSATMIALLFLNLNKSWKNRSALIIESQSGQSVNLPKKISKGRVNFFSLNGFSEKIIFYDESDYMVYESGYDGKMKKEVARIPGVLEMIFGPKGEDAIAAISESGNLKRYYFDLGNDSRTALNQNIKSVAFSPDGRKIAYYFYDGRLAEGNISVSDPDGSGFKNIFKTRIEDLEISWPNDGLIVFRSKKEVNLFVFSISPEGENFRRLTEEESAAAFGEKIAGAEKEIFENLDIDALKIKLSPLKNYIIFINSSDGKLYSLGL